MAIERTTEKTAFVVLHEHFENGTPSIKAFERLAQTDSAVAARVNGPDYDDLILVRFDRKPDEPTELTVDGDSLTFKGYGWVRRQGDSMTIVGDIVSGKIAAAGVTKVTLNGEDASAGLADEIFTIK